jgi:hypothetical protein
MRDRGRKEESRKERDEHLEDRKEISTKRKKEMSTKRKERNEHLEEGTR